MHVTNKKSGKFTQGDLEILTFLASHLTIFIENAILYEREIIQAEKMSLLNTQLRTHQTRLEKLNAVQNNLIQQVLNEDGMPLMIKTFADLLNAPVYLEDSHFNLLLSSHSEGISLSTWELMEQQGKTDMIRNGQMVTSAPYSEGDRRLIRIIAPIGGPQYAMGYLSMVIEETTVLSDVKILAFQQGAMAFALEMMKDRIKFEVEARFQGEFLDDLFSGKYEKIKNIARRADFYQYDLEKNSRVVLISLEIDEEAKKELPEGRDYNLYQGFHHLVISMVQKKFSGSLAVGKRNRVEVLLPVATNMRGNGVQQQLAELRKQLVGYFLQGRVLVGVGGECPNMTDYRGSYQQACKALEVGRFLAQPNGVVFYDQLGIYGLLLEISDLSLLKNLVASKLGPLLEYDGKKNSNLAHTLEIYLKRGGSLKETAEDLFVHVATLKYRLGRIQELLGVDLHETANHFDLQLALFAHRFLSKSQVD